MFRLVVTIVLSTGQSHSAVIAFTNERSFVPHLAPTDSVDFTARTEVNIAFHIVIYVVLETPSLSDLPSMQVLQIQIDNLHSNAHIACWARTSVKLPSL